jgi:hypothetical protein
MLNTNLTFKSFEEAFNKTDTEAVLDVQNLNLKVKVTRNESLVDERKTKINKDALSENVILIYLDTLSRAHAHRKLPLTF